MIRCNKDCLKEFSGAVLEEVPFIECGCGVSFATLDRIAHYWR